jgi:hypothetical protein
MAIPNLYIGETYNASITYTNTPTAPISFVWTHGANVSLSSTSTQNTTITGLTSTGAGTVPVTAKVVSGGNGGCESNVVTSAIKVCNQIDNYASSVIQGPTQITPDGTTYTYNLAPPITDGTTVWSIIDPIGPGNWTVNQINENTAEVSTVGGPDETVVLLVVMGDCKGATSQRTINISNFNAACVPATGVSID